MSPRRQATAERGWFRFRNGTPGSGTEPAGSGEQAEGGAGQAGSGQRNGHGVPLAAPTTPPAAADAGTSPDADGQRADEAAGQPGTGSAATEAGAAAQTAATGAAPDAQGQPATESATPASTTRSGTPAGTAPAAPPPPAADAPTMTRPAPWVHFGGPRRGTARSRAAEADLAARASTLAPPADATGPEPGWKRPGQEVPAAGPDQGTQRVTWPVPAGPARAGQEQAEDLPADTVAAGTSQEPPSGQVGAAPSAAAAVPALPTASAVLEEPAVPAGPAEPGVPVGPAAPEVPAGPAVPGVPAEPAAPGVPAVPAGPAAPAVSAIPVPAEQAVHGAAEERPASLSARLIALAGMIRIGALRTGKTGFTPKLLADAQAVLAQAGERMRLSSAHTVVVLAGGTGSGKSSLFNRLAGADLSPVGVTRPVTKEAHACVWGEQGAGPILEWLDVPGRYRYARASALDSGEDDLAGLVLLDVPDHDSVVSQAGELVDRFVGMSDVLVWVLDPQKYADAAVHRRFLVPMAGHSAVVAVILNQVDLIDPAQVDDCVADLRRLLDAENLHDVPIVVTSAASGSGLDDLRALLARGVASRRAAAARISADVDSVVRRFLPFAETASKTGAEESAADSVSAGVPASASRRLAERFAEAAGIAAIGEALRSARELRAIDYVGWPVAWFAQRLTGRGKARKARIGELWSDLHAVTAGPAGAQQSEIDNALTDLGAELARPLPHPWSETIRSTVRSRADDIPAAIGTAIAEALPAEDATRWWWRLAGLWQGLLLGAAAVAVAWSVLIVVVRATHAQANMPGLMSEPAAVPWLVAAAILALVLGWATTWLCMKAVVSTARRETAKLTGELRDKIAAVAQLMAIAQADQEMAEFLHFREEARIAASGMDLAVG